MIPILTPATIQSIKCVIWDLDDTVWRGILSEDSSVELVSTAKTAIELLDSKGILNSIASRNDYAQAKEQLIKLGLWDYFVYPQIDWNDKAESILTIINKLNFQSNALMFIDDQDFELARVQSILPAIHLLKPDQLVLLVDSLQKIATNPSVEAIQRRQFYQQEAALESMAHLNPADYAAFLAETAQTITIKKASVEDLGRALELTERTHQLNTTGYTYSYEELAALIQSPAYDVYTIQFKDKFGDYGHIGLILIEKNQDGWLIKLFILSCRVLSRNITQTLIKYLIRQACENNVAIWAEFIDTGLNQKMYLAYKFSGFDDVTINNKKSLLKFNPAYPIPSLPNQVKIITLNDTMLATNS